MSKLEEAIFIELDKLKAEGKENSPEFLAALCKLRNHIHTRLGLRR